MGSFTDAGNLNGLLGGITGAASSYFAGQGQASAYEMQYGAAADKALFESQNLADKYELGGMEALINASSRASEYEIKGVQYQNEAEKMRGEGALYESKAAYSDAEAEYAMRNADTLKRAGHEAVEAGGEAERKLRQEGRSFRADQVGAMAASGTAIDTGTAIDILRQTDEGIERDAAMLRVNAAKERYAAMVQEQEQWVKAAFARGDAANYRTAASGMQRSADLIAQGTDVMNNTAQMVREMGVTEKDAYERIASIVRQSGISQSNALRGIGSTLASGAKTASTFQALGQLSTTVGSMFSASAASGGSGASGVGITRPQAQALMKKQFGGIFTYGSSADKNIQGLMQKQFGTIFSYPGVSR